MELAAKTGDRVVVVSESHEPFVILVFKEYQALMSHNTNLQELTEQERWQVLHGPAPHIASLDPATGKLRATKANHFLQDRGMQRNFSFTGILGTREQDTAVVEGMGAIVDRTQEHLGTSDMAIIGMLRQLLNGAKALLKGVEPKAATQPELYRVRAWSAVLPRSEEFLTDPKVKELMQPMVQ